MSKELTDAWKLRKLKAGAYYVRLSNGRVDVAKLSKFNRFYAISYKFEVVEVLSPCDYDHFVELTEKVKELEQDVKTLTNNYKLLEKQQAENLAHGQALVDEFGDFEALYEEIVRLRKEVAKGDEIIGKLLNEGHAAIEKNKQLSRLLKGRLEKALNNN